MICHAYCKLKISKLTMFCDTPYVVEEYHNENDLLDFEPNKDPKLAGMEL